MTAAKEIEGIDSKKDRRRIIQRIRDLADEPRPQGVQKLSVRELYRIRQGPYRIVFSIDDEQVEVCVIKVGHRRDVYRGNL